jgi:hypothetical protein
LGFVGRLKESIAAFIRLRPNTLQVLPDGSASRAAGMKGKVNRAVARQSEGGFGYGAIPL